MVEVLLLELEDLACQGLTQVDHRTTAEGIEVYSIDKVLTDGDVWIDTLGFAQRNFAHFVHEVIVSDDVARAPNLEVALLLDVDDNVKGIVRTEHLRQDVTERIFHHRDQRIAVNALELLILEERFNQAGSLFLLCHRAIIRFILLLMNREEGG